MLTVYRASAGAGKTFTLVKHYLEMAFDATDTDSLRRRFGHILAITFTNKSANEMKERILEELDRIIIGTSDYKGFDPAKALIVKQSILHNYSDFSVCTIDSFMHRIVRTFAHDLHLPLNFDVQIDNEDIINHAVDSLMAHIGTEGEEELTRIIVNYAVNRIEEGLSYNVDAPIRDLAKILFNEDTPGHLNKIKNLSPNDFVRLRADLAKDNAAYKARVQACAQKAIDLCNSHNLDADSFNGKSTGIYSYFDKLAKGSLEQYDKANTKAVNAIDSGKLASPTASAADKAGIEAITPDLINIFNQLQQLGEHEYRLYNTRQNIIRDLYALATMNRLNGFKNDYSEENDIVHISEFNKRINDEVRANPTPFIYERLGNFYQNYLIDEFQDTSRMQWQNLEPLISESVSQHILGEGSTNLSSILVGDGKQSIYRFRQGDVQQFIDLPYILKDGKLQSIGGATRDNVRTLWSNHRSASQVVQFNNSFFHWLIHRQMAGNPRLADIYLNPAEPQEQLHQDPVEKNRGGFVCLKFRDTKSSDDMMLSLHETLNDLVGRCGYRQRDIMILAFKNNILADIAEYLNDKTIAGQDVRIVSSETYKLSNSTTVSTLIAMLKWVVRPYDRLIAAQAFNMLTQTGIVNADLSDFCLGNQSLSTVLQRHGITLQPHRLAAMSVYDCCEALVRALQPDVLEPAYVATFLNTAHDYSLHHSQSLADFVEWLEQSLPKLTCQTSSTPDAMQLLTIHKAKGMGHAIVILFLPFRQEKGNDIWVDLSGDGIGIPVARLHKSKKATTYDDQMLSEQQDSEMDRINALYVALTRAKRRLYVIGQTAATKDGSVSKHADPCVPSLWDFVQELNSGSLLGDKAVEIPAPEATQLDDVTTYSWGNDGTAATDLPLNPMRATSDTVKKSDDKRNETSIVTVNNLHMPPWQNRILIARRDDNNCSDPDESASSQRRYGIRVHDILSHIRTADDIDSAIDTYSSSYSIPPAEADTLRAHLRRIVTHPVCAHFFSPDAEVRNECPLIYLGEERRPDRIVNDGNNIWVVDFKTGKPSEEARKGYHTQVTAYCDALRLMGYTNVRGVLLYIGNGDCDPHIEEVGM